MTVTFPVAFPVQVQHVRRAPQSLWMSKLERCSCEKPLLRERSEQKGSSESWCGRCKLPLALRPTAFRSAFGQ